MALGHRSVKQRQDLFAPMAQLTKAIGNVYYRKLSELLAGVKLDRWGENLYEAHYANKEAHTSVPPGIYYGMLIVGYFEGIQPQRGIASRCADSHSLREFLGIPLALDSSNHSSPSYFRKRPSEVARAAVFEWVRKLAVDKQLLKGTTVAVDSSTLEANAAMKSLIRRDTGEEWREYVARLMKEEGVVPADHTLTDEEVRNFDKKRKDKKVSSEDWVSETDPAARIARMKDGTTHLANKVEHVVDLDSSLIMAAEVYDGDQADVATLEDCLNAAQTHQREAGSEAVIMDVAADKAYHSAETLETIDEETPYLTYNPEPKSQRNGPRRGPLSKPSRHKTVKVNCRRMKGAKGRRLKRLRSEEVERTFSDVLETGAATRLASLTLQGPPAIFIGGPWSQPRSTDAHNPRNRKSSELSNDRVRSAGGLVACANCLS